MLFYRLFETILLRIFRKCGLQRKTRAKIRFLRKIDFEVLELFSKKKGPRNESLLVNNLLIISGRFVSI